MFRRQDVAVNDERKGLEVSRDNHVVCGLLLACGKQTACWDMQLCYLCLDGNIHASVNLHWFDDSVKLESVWKQRISATDIKVEHWRACSTMFPSEYAMEFRHIAKFTP